MVQVLPGNWPAKHAATCLLSPVRFSCENTDNPSLTSNRGCMVYSFWPSGHGRRRLIATASITPHWCALAMQAVHMATKHTCRRQVSQGQDRRASVASVPVWHSWPPGGAHVSQPLPRHPQHSPDSTPPSTTLSSPLLYSTAHTLHCWF